MTGLRFGTVVKIYAPAEKNLHCNARLRTLPLHGMGSAYVFPPINTERKHFRLSNRRADCGR